jgi:hypothetical protein
LGKTIVNSQVSSVYPAIVSQSIEQRPLGLIERLPASVTYGEKAKSMASTLRAQTP